VAGGESGIREGTDAGMVAWAVTVVGIEEEILRMDVVNGDAEFVA